EFAHRLVRGTPLEAEFRSIRVDHLRAETEGRSIVLDVYARFRYADYLKETPEDAEVLNDFAWFLSTCPRKRIRDPARAVPLAERAVDLARRGGDAATLASFLDTLGAARFASGDARGAAEAQEEAVRVCPAEPPALRAELEKRLEEYRKAAGR
ncbi:MAG: hypothetical protein MUC63_04160, partial [Planctomycetes bacterium]|nr:hypothetical protein [Planctomycetota bacterium]